MGFDCTEEVSAPRESHNRDILADDQDYSCIEAVLRAN